jgi:hypothetical protein
LSRLAAVDGPEAEMILDRFRVELTALDLPLVTGRGLLR